MTAQSGRSLQHSAEDSSPITEGGRRRGRPGYDLGGLLAVAVEVFDERGYDGTSMEDLSKRLGIAKSAIYHHVSGKEELLRLALDRALDGLTAVADEARALPTTRAVDKLEFVLRGSVAVLQAELPYVKLLLHVHGTTEVERSALERRRTVDRFVAGLVRQAQRDGDLRGDLDPTVVARLLFGLVNSLVEWYRPGRSADVADTLLALAFDGLRAPR